MKKLIINSQMITRNLATAARVLGMIACLMVANIATAQVDCNTTMACNDGLQVSLDDNCVVTITPDMILEDPQYADDQYTVVLMDAANQQLPTAEVDYSYVNQTLSVNILLNGCAASCWGNITIEDKLPPVLTNCEDLIVDCDDNITPGVGVPGVTAIDACGPVTDIDYTDTEETNACANDFVKTVTRVWTATDQQGNEATCTQLILVRKATVADVVFPPNYDDIELPAFSCAITLETLPNGAPTPEVTGYPEGASCPNIQTYYTDVVFPICGASIKVLRQWVIIDWCTGEEATENQVIKILDDKAPICTATPDFINEIPTDEGLCTGTFTVPAPIVIFECSDYTYNVGYKLRDENGDPYEDPIYDNVSYNPLTDLFTITGLPQDTSWIVYTLTDACGNTSQCFTEVFVEDLEAPTPVCEGYTVVGLEDAGWADIFGSSIDDDSYDNCEIDRFEVRRESTPCGFSSDLTFGEKVNFCCEDVGAGYVKVIMRVFDKSGNYNDCYVNVQDKINPEITCPSNVTIQCTQDYTDLSLTGTAIGTDNCSVEVTNVDNVNLDECGKGIVTRTWSATDPQGRVATCTQTIYVVDSNPFNSNNISWPTDLEVDGCDASEASPEELNSFPILSNTDCTNIAISYDDDVFYVTNDYCIKVLRHWRIVDWCNYDPQNPSYFEYTQKIGFTNDVAPTFEACSNESFTSTDGDCQEEVTITVNATDDCTPASQLKYSYVLDVDNNGSIDYNGTTNTFTRTLDAGTHKVVFTVVDKCHNESVCTKFITIKDTKAPTPICIGEVVWVLGEDGTTEVWASDFDLKSEAACGSDDDLIFSFNAAGTQQSLFFSCADIDNGIAQEIPLEMHVIDASGNSEFCSVTLILQDSQSSNACADDLGKASISGHIVNSNNEGILDIEVELMDMNAQDANMDMTQQDGVYAFDDVNYYGTYAIEPYKNDDAANGVSTLDLVMVQRHILGLQELDSPYKIIAADVNGSNKLTSSDLLLMRKVILGINTTFADNTSWRFLPTTFEIEDPADPFGFPEKVEFNELYVSNNDINFTAIKTGDVNGSATTGLKNEAISETRSGAKSLYVANQSFNSGSDVIVTINANEVRSMVGMQFTMEYDATMLNFKGMTNGKLSMNNYNVKVDNGSLLISWNAINALELSSEDELFSLNFTAINDGVLNEAIEMNSNGIQAEYYDESLNVYDLSLELENRSVISDVANTLHQNSPNPFKGMTAIGFDLKEGGVATIAIFDIAGRELYNITKEFNQGYNEMTIDVTSLNTNSGILYYTLKAGDFIDTKKMMIIK